MVMHAQRRSTNSAHDASHSHAGSLYTLISSSSLQADKVGDGDIDQCTHGACRNV